MKRNGSAAIKMPNLSKREIILVVLFLFAAIIAGYYRFVFEPQWKNIQKLKTDLLAQQSVLNQRKAQGWNDIGDLQLQAAEIKTNIDKMYKKISNIKDEPTIMVDLYKMSVAHKLYTEDIKFSPLKEVEGKGYSSFDVTLAFMGTKMDIYNFIDSLENYNRLNRISEIIFLPITSGLVACLLTVEFYALHEVVPDPKEYPFMVGEVRKNQPYNMFYQHMVLNPEFLKNGGQKGTPLFVPPQQYQITPQPPAKSQEAQPDPQKTQATPKPIDLPIPPGVSW